jgi:hypothetical protein
MSLAHGAVTEPLSEMAFTRPTGAGDEEVGWLLDKAARGQFLDEGPVDAGIEIKIKLFDGLLRTEASAADAKTELFLFPSGDFVLDKQGEELGIGELGLYGLAVSSGQGFEDAGESELLEQWGEFGHGLHSRSFHWIRSVVLRWKRELPV